MDQHHRRTGPGALIMDAVPADGEIQFSDWPGSLPGSGAHAFGRMTGNRTGFSGFQWNDIASVASLGEPIAAPRFCADHSASPKTRQYYRLPGFERQPRISFQDIREPAPFDLKAGSITAPPSSAEYFFSGIMPFMILALNPSLLNAVASIEIWISSS